MPPALPPLSRATAFLASVCVLVLSALGACAKSSTQNGGPLGPGPQVPVVSITSAGVTPKAVQIDAGGRVRFVNSDTVSHTIGSDPHPEHTDCPEINQVGFLQPGQSRETGNFVAAGTCTFHDDQRPDVQALHGAITTR